MSMNLFAQITKVDVAKREGWGRAAQEVPDHSGEIMDYESSKPLFDDWSNEIQKATDGKSMGNVRSMHGNVAAGKVISMSFDDALKSVDVGVKVVDDNEWEKVLEGVHSGFSIGGKYVKKWQDGDLTRYTAQPNEISLVDRPCIPTATFFDIVKADGIVEQVKFKSQPSAEGAQPGGADMSEQTTEVTKAVEAAPVLTVSAIDQLAEILNKGEVSPDRLVELAELEKADTKAIEAITDDDVKSCHDAKSWDSPTDEEKGHLKDAKAAHAESEGFTKGDFPGHPFHGNQYGSGESGRAVHASMRAKGNGTKTNHARAASAHRAAAKAATKAGHTKTAAYHNAMAAFHSGRSGASKAEIAEFEKATAREDVTPAGKKEAQDKYGDVKFADAKNKKYPIDTEAYIRATWSRINQEKNADKYDAADLKEIKDEIIAAWKEVIDKAGPPAVAEKMENPHQLAKGMYTVSSLAQLLDTLNSIQQSAQWEADYEGDDSPVPDALKDAVKQLSTVLVAMATEEAAELTADPASTASADVVALADKAGDLAKTGARNSKADQEHLQAAHDHLVSMGASCHPGNDTAADPDQMGADKGNKDVAATPTKAEPAGDLLKAAIPEPNQKLLEIIAGLEARLKKVESTPMPMPGTLRAVGKSEDVTHQEVKKIESTPGQHNPEAALALIKQQFEQAGGLRKL